MAKAATKKKTAAKKTATKKAPSRKTKSGVKSTTGKSLKAGDKVAWNTSQGRTTGRVVKKQTSSTKIKTHKVAASRDNPEFIVESEKSGKRAAHKASALKKA